MPEETVVATGAPEVPEFKSQAEYRAWRSKSAVDETPETPEAPTETVETSEGQEPESAEATDTTEPTSQELEEAVEKPLTRGQKRFQELVGQRKAAEEKAAALEARLAALEASKQAAPAVEAKPEPAEDFKPIPKLSQFDYDEEKHAVALQEVVNHNAALAAKRFQAEQAAQAQKQQIQTKWQESIEAAKAKMPDFEAVAFNPEAQRFISPVMAEIVITNADAPLAYHLGKNPKEAQRISALHPAVQIYELGKLAAKLSTPEQPVTPKPAPLPVPSKLSAAGGGSSLPDLEAAAKVSQKAYRAAKERLNSRR